MKNTDGNHGIHGKAVPVPPFFRVFRAFRGSNSLMLYIIAGAENPNHESITTYNEVIMGMLSPCLISSVFSVLSVVLTH